ncbi:ribosome biogenesis GTPase Der [Blastopirellula sp. JC732]|uniref:GTPase Der n=1 Tax=Blastopirellula sediminis TaxID=2894196 RepID=A0A9X1MNR3_9BACT|nr:ribosome biogenesis GTPase Der [Blastopirellula sediminis]MCC9607080.1 ribosome biogenesis GTPase Der [Blastopirellula sediminis]MCC9629627.1 ribosome biogenesis GTPase Der [Blastopirellula sediminis]
MSLPQVVIVGRPNVGKSSLFNWLAGRRLAIVDNVAGVTRDRMTYLMQWRDRYFEIVDTGGIGINDVDDLTDEIEQQINIAIDSADLILFVVDTRDGILPLDQEVAQRLRHVNKPIVLVANKTDESHMDHDADQFYQLGRGMLVPVSTLQNRNKDDLLNVIADRLPDAEEGEASSGEPEMKIAVVGRRNVGKSTFVNTLARAERMIVSEVAGTTRDSVDIRFELDGKSFTAIDTPGLRRRVSVKTDIDFYSTHRAERSIRRADVVLMFFDASQQISKVDKQLVAYIAENYKPVVFVVNKWDLYHDKMPTDRWATYLHDTFRNIPYAPVAFITGQTGKNVKALLNHAQMLYKQSRERISTGELNRIIRFALEKSPPPLYKLRRPKIYFATQIGAQPPTIVLKCNSPKAFSDGYRRYLLSMLRDHVSFSEVPIKLYLHRRQEADFKGGDGEGGEGSISPHDGDLADGSESDMLNELNDD